MTPIEKLTCALICIGCLALLFWLAWADMIQAQSITMPTQQYRLDTGDMVLTWLDERRGVQCFAILGTGLTCIPLTASVYNWPILEVTP